MQSNNKFETTTSNNEQLYVKQKYKQNNIDGRYKNEVKSQSLGRSEIKSSNYSSKTQKKVVDTTNIIKSFLAIVSTVVIAAVGISTFTTNVKASFDFLEVYDTAVYYSVVLTDYEGDENCYVNLYNDFTNRTFEITDNRVDGFFENLQPNMYYTLAVKVGKNVILEKTIFTKFLRENYNGRPKPDYQSDYPDYNQTENPKYEDDADYNEEITDEDDYDKTGDETGDNQVVDDNGYYLNEDGKPIYDEDNFNEENNFEEYSPEEDDYDDEEDNDNLEADIEGNDNLVENDENNFPTNDEANNENSNSNNNSTNGRN